MIKLFVICKNDLFFKIIDPLLNPWDIRIAAISNTTTAAVEAYNSSKADIIIMDANWYDDDPTGKETLASLLNNDAGCKVIVVTTFYEPEIEQQYRRLGASGYFYKNGPALAEIRECILSAYRSTRGNGASVLSSDDQG